MNLTNGDYVSSVWCCESLISKWAIWLIMHNSNWEVVLEWDDKIIGQQTICHTVIHRTVLLGSLLESAVVAQVEALVSALETEKKSKRLALIEVRSTDPATITGQIYETALQNENIAMCVCINDNPRKS